MARERESSVLGDINYSPGGGGREGGGDLSKFVWGPKVFLFGKFEKGDGR